MRYATILFDIGDTLLQVPKPAAVYQQLLARYGKRLTLAAVGDILEATRAAMDERVPRWVAEDLTLDREASARRRALHVDSIISLAGLDGDCGVRQAFFDLYVSTEFFTLFPDATDTLRRLHGDGYHLGIVSNWESRLRQLCAAHGIDHYFDFAVISEVEGFSKPHPHMYRRALELAGASPEQVLHVGDKLREDVEGAASVGIRAVLVDRANANGVDYQPRIASLSALFEVLDA
jgi:HAD superfamily hydrolase (TIGR01662 family)